nr:immunoglobulin heavy chain junction region [Macaca mulatta]MOX14625.1 immunoglobulin heavy chain junction region [Macaca mulatta]MOX14631.1 immunoglobulin heavy chain junction region [Macaca mulatta]MOX14648.1 immunoglobulin heavy chain junction region [Macaca mulatta]MOX14664.1 immunoglobulin heavy chain junction region [Macaca mulatta]
CARSSGSGYYYYSYSWFDVW